MGLQVNYKQKRMTKDIFLLMDKRRKHKNDPSDGMYSIHKQIKPKLPAVKTE